MSSRKKSYDGEAAGVAAVLAEVAAAHGKSFCKFDESNNVKDARYVPSDIAYNHPVAMGLYTLSPQLKFKRTTMEAAVAEVLDKNNDKSKVKDKAGYIETMTRRLQNLTHAICHGERTKTPAAKGTQSSFMDGTLMCSCHIARRLKMS